MSFIGDLAVFDHALNYHNDAYLLAILNNK